MEKYKKGTSEYWFTEHFNEVPDRLYEQISSMFEFQNESFIAICFLKARSRSTPFYYILITTKRVISQNIQLEQNLFKNITGIEQKDIRNIVIRSGGNNTSLFLPFFLPSKELHERLFKILNRQWLDDEKTYDDSWNRKEKIVDQSFIAKNPHPNLKKKNNSETFPNISKTIFKLEFLPILGLILFLVFNFSILSGIFFIVALLLLHPVSFRIINWKGNWQNWHRKYAVVLFFILGLAYILISIEVPQNKTYSHSIKIEKKEVQKQSKPIIKQKQNKAKQKEISREIENNFFYNISSTRNKLSSIGLGILGSWKPDYRPGHYMSITSYNQLNDGSPSNNLALYLLSDSRNYIKTIELELNINNGNKNSAFRSFSKTVEKIYSALDLKPSTGIASAARAGKEISRRSEGYIEKIIIERSNIETWKFIIEKS